MVFLLQNLFFKMTRIKKKILQHENSWMYHQMSIRFSEQVIAKLVNFLVGYTSSFSFQDATESIHCQAAIST